MRRQRPGCRVTTGTWPRWTAPTATCASSPQVLATVRFAGGTAAAGLLEAVEILRELNATGARRVPDDAPTGFVPARWRSYLETAAKAGNTSAYRHYWELCTLLALRDGCAPGTCSCRASAKADSLCCRWPWKAFPSGQTAAAVRESWPWVRRCPCEGEIEIRWVLLEPSRVRRAESGTRGLPADADRAPIRFPRRARLYV